MLITTTTTTATATATTAAAAAAGVVVVVVAAAAAADFILCVLEFQKGIIKACKLSTVILLQMSATHC